MWSKKSVVVTAFLFALLLTATAADATLVLVTDRSQIPSQPFDWGQLGPAFTPVPQEFQVGDFVAMETLDVKLASGPGERVDEGNGWNGNFTAGDHLLWTQGNGPVTISFLTYPVYAAGLQIQANFYGSFTAEIQAFRGNTLLGTFTENGNSNGNEDGSAIFIGVAGGGLTTITSVQFSIISCTADCTDFAVNELSFVGNFTDIPEPASILLVGSGLFAGIGTLRTRSKQSQ